MKSNCLYCENNSSETALAVCSVISPVDIPDGVFFAKPCPGSDWIYVDGTAFACCPVYSHSWKKHLTHIAEVISMYVFTFVGTIAFISFCVMLGIVWGW